MVVTSCSLCATRRTDRALPRRTKTIQMPLSHAVDTEGETSGRHKHGKALAVCQHGSRARPNTTAGWPSRCPRIMSCSHGMRKGIRARGVIGYTGPGVRLAPWEKLLYDLKLATSSRWTVRASARLVKPAASGA